MDLLGEILLNIVGEALSGVLEGAIGKIVPMRHRIGKVATMSHEPFLEGLMLAVALDGRLDATELAAIEARARRLWRAHPLGAWLENARAAVAHVRTDEEATAAFAAIGARMAAADRAVLLDAVAALSLLEANGRPDVAYLCARAMGVSDGETDRRLERMSR